MKNKEEIILKREGHLLKNEKSWRRARIGAIFLFFVFLIAILVIYGDDLISKNDRHKALAAVSIWCLFWVMIIEFLTLRIRHIDSINLHRSKFKESKFKGSDTVSDK